MKTKLRFVNRSEAANEPDVVIFQNCPVTGLGAQALAWKVIKRCGFECFHPFVYSHALEICAVDGWGNFTPAVPAEPGDRLAVINWPVGNAKRVQPAGESSDSREIEVLNGLASGAVQVVALRNGQALISMGPVVPQQKAVLVPTDIIYVAAVAGIEQGAPVASMVIDDSATAIPLVGIASADMVMKGGGPGKNSKPFTFSLENIVPA